MAEQYTQHVLHPPRSQGIADLTGINPPTFQQLEPKPQMSEGNIPALNVQTYPHHPLSIIQQQTQIPVQKRITVLRSPIRQAGHLGRLNTGAKRSTDEANMRDKEEPPSKTMKLKSRKEVPETTKRLLILT